MTPPPGERLVRFVGDRIHFGIQGDGARAGWQARLRTNLGRGRQLHHEIIAARFKQVPFAGASWRDIPMVRTAAGWELELALVETGYFKAKAYLIDEHGYQHWPEGPDFGVNVQPDHARTANTVYCAFPRMFGPGKERATTVDEAAEAEYRQLDGRGFTVIPPSGKLRDLIAELPHIVDTLGCRWLHLLPVNPTPTTYARFGRYGSPYACEDLTAVDPALVEFDQRTTGVDQFCELTAATHARGARVLLDIVINHTGWGSWLQENHPEWFVRHPDGKFESPGAWGVVWEDLVELDQRWPGLWEHLAEALLVWCRRGVDGFRCDAGYKIPMPVWQYLTARVRQEFPDTVFLLEGLGGGWHDTESLLTEGGMQWAYSELFQNHGPEAVAGYLDHALTQSARTGVLVHYSETHDNLRLAASGRAWSLLRNQLCALTSVSGGFGFTCGVEWLAAERFNVHSRRGLHWGNPDNLVRELAALNRLLAGHPCFFDGATATRISPPDSPVYALIRRSAEGAEAVLVLVNLDLQAARQITLAGVEFLGAEPQDLLGRELADFQRRAGGTLHVLLAPGEARCLGAATAPAGLSGDAYRRARAQAQWALRALRHRFEVEHIGPADWRSLAALADRDPLDFLRAVAHLTPAAAGRDLLAALEAAGRGRRYLPVVRWAEADRRRITLVPPGHWLLVEDPQPFQAWLETAARERIEFQASAPLGGRHFALLRADGVTGDLPLCVQRLGDRAGLVTATVRCLPGEPDLGRLQRRGGEALRDGLDAPLVLLTNGRGGMARLCLDLGLVKSKYDCVLGANLHPGVPVDRHVLVKRLRAWVNADGFITALNAGNLLGFEPGPPAHWRFLANAGDGRTVELHLVADLLEGRNALALRFYRAPGSRPGTKPLPAGCDVRLTVRFDLEDRNFHWETTRNSGAEHHFQAHCRSLEKGIGFAFQPAADRGVRIVAERGAYHPQAEWSQGLPHPVEASRGQPGQGDAFSPGWFDLPMASGTTLTLVATAEPGEPSIVQAHDFIEQRQRWVEGAVRAAGVAAGDAFARQLAIALRAFVVRRGEGCTVIAGYPWFLDWGRDSLIAARGMLAAGMREEVRALLRVFGRFERAGTLPNTIHGEDASNRDTSDAPLWYGVVCADWAAAHGAQIYQEPVDDTGRTVLDVLRSIAAGYLSGTPNGIRVDPASGLVWSPSHFTWMDTNYPAGTPREGYPLEIQALWIRLLQQLDSQQAPSAGEPWGRLARRAVAAVEQHFWLEHQGWYADCLRAVAGTGAAQAEPDQALRSNCVLALSLGVLARARARRCLEAAQQWLVVPGALRSLAPLPAEPPLPIHAPDGRLLNDPRHPYWGHYAGDEDTRRKPAYHNGTAWTWTFPAFCEALAEVWENSPEAVAAARAYLGSLDRLLVDGCVGQLPEIVDGDAPHQQRGCDAQAWGVSEALRVWQKLAPRS